MTKSATLLKVNRKEYIQAALKQPQLFYLTPETIAAKAKIYSYYKELINEPAKNLLSCVRLMSDKHLLAQVLGTMINSQTNEHLHIVTRTRYNDIIGFLKSHPGHYDLVADYRDVVAEKLLKFTKEIEKELNNKVSFKITLR